VSFSKGQDNVDTNPLSIGSQREPAASSKHNNNKDLVGQTFLSAPDLKVRLRKLPHWRLAGATYFITFRLSSGRLSSEERRLVLDHIVSGDPEFYELIATQVMPDHVHIVLCPQPAASLSRIMKGIKGISARKLNQMRATKGRIWQDEYFDRIVRDNDELLEKLQYMFHNPVERGLVDDPSHYDGWYMK